MVKSREDGLVLTEARQKMNPLTVSFAMVGCRVTSINI